MNAHGKKPRIRTLWQGILVLLGLGALALVLAVLALIGVIAAGRVYVQHRMEQVDQQVLGLAQQLGYTPDALLQQSKYMRDVSPTILFMGACVNELYFTTPMTADMFTERLNQVSPSANGKRRQYEEAFFAYFDLPVEVKDADDEKARAVWERGAKTTYQWASFHVADSIWVFLYDTEHLPITLTYRQNPIKGNIVRLLKDDVGFPAWFNCPVETIERQ